MSSHIEVKEEPGEDINEQYNTNIKEEALDDEYIENSDDNMDQDPLGDPLDIAEQDEDSNQQEAEILDSKPQNKVCSECGETFPTSKELFNHKRNHRTVNYVCQICLDSKGWKRIDHYKRHMEIHKRNGEWPPPEKTQPSPFVTLKPKSANELKAAAAPAKLQLFPRERETIKPNLKILNVIKCKSSNPNTGNVILKQRDESAVVKGKPVLLTTAVTSGAHSMSSLGTNVLLSRQKANEEMIKPKPVLLTAVSTSPSLKIKPALLTAKSSTPTAEIKPALLTAKSSTPTAEIKPATSTPSIKIEPVSLIPSVEIKQVTSTPSVEIEPVSSIAKVEIKPVLSIATVKIEPVSSTPSVEMNPVFSSPSVEITPIATSVAISSSTKPTSTLKLRSVASLMQEPLKSTTASSNCLISTTPKTTLLTSKSTILAPKQNAVESKTNVILSSSKSKDKLITKPSEVPLNLKVNAFQAAERKQSLFISSTTSLTKQTEKSKTVFLEEKRSLPFTNNMATENIKTVKTLSLKRKRSEDDIVVVEKDISEDIKKEVDEIVDLSKDIKEEIEDIADEYVQPLECLELTMDEKETDDMEDSYESEEKSSTTNKPSRSTKEAYKESIHNWADREYKQLQLSEDLDHHDVNVPRNTLLCRLCEGNIRIPVSNVLVHTMTAHRKPNKKGIFVCPFCKTECDIYESTPGTRNICLLTHVRSKHRLHACGFCGARLLKQTTHKCKGMGEEFRKTENKFVTKNKTSKSKKVKLTSKKNVNPKKSKQKIDKYASVYDDEDYSEDVLEINEEVLNQNHDDIQEKISENDAPIAENHTMLKCKFCNCKLQNSHCRLHYEMKHLAMFTSMNKHFCPHCDYETEILISLWSHFQTVHSKREKCENCNVRFTNLAQHYEKCVGSAKMKVCNLCGKLLKNLSNHSCPFDQKRKANQPIECGRCGNVMKEKYLRIHQKNHCVGEKSSSFSNFRTERIILPKL